MYHRKANTAETNTKMTTAAKPSMSDNGSDVSDLSDEPEVSGVVDPSDVGVTKFAVIVPAPFTIAVVAVDEGEATVMSPVVFHDENL